MKLISWEVGFAGQPCPPNQTLLCGNWRNIQHDYYPIVLELRVGWAAYRLFIKQLRHCTVTVIMLFVLSPPPPLTQIRFHFDLLPLLKTELYFLSVRKARFSNKSKHRNIRTTTNIILKVISEKTNAVKSTFPVG